jgi:exocyst complex component 7
MAFVDSQRRTQMLSACLQKMESTTTDAYRCCDLLTKRARQLDSLTSPASDASSMLSRANANLAAALLLMKDAREKFDTVNDCEPAIERLHKGVMELEEKREAGGRTKGTFKNRIMLTEQDVYAAADAMEILRDTYSYFIQRKSWRSAPTTLSGLERVHKMGMDAMCLLTTSHLKAAGQAVRPKRNVKKEGIVIAPTEETAKQVRQTYQFAIYGWIDQFKRLIALSFTFL